MIAERPENIAIAWVPPRGLHAGSIPAPLRSLVAAEIGTASTVRDLGHVIHLARSLTSLGARVRLVPERVVVAPGDLLPSVAGRRAEASCVVLGDAEAAGADRGVRADGIRQWRQLTAAAVAALVGDISTERVAEALDEAAAEPLRPGVDRLLPPDGAGLDAGLHPLSELRAGIVLSSNGLSSAAVDRIVRTAGDLSGSEPITVLTTPAALADGCADRSLAALFSQLPPRTTVHVVLEANAEASNAEASDGDPLPAVAGLLRDGAAVSVLTDSVATAAAVSARTPAEVGVVLCGGAGAAMTPEPDEVADLMRLDATRVGAVLDATWVLDWASERDDGAAPGGEPHQPDSVGAAVAARSQLLIERAVGALNGTLPRPEVVDVLSDIVLLDSTSAGTEGIGAALAGASGTATLVWATDPRQPGASGHGSVLPLPADAVEMAARRPGPRYDITRSAAASVVVAAGTRPWMDGPVLDLPGGRRDSNRAASRWVSGVEDYLAEQRDSAPIEVGEVTCERALAGVGDRIDPAAPLHASAALAVRIGETRAAVCDLDTGAVAVLSRRAGLVLVAATDATGKEPADREPTGDRAENIWRLLDALRQRGINVPLPQRPAPQPDPAALALAEEATAIQLYRDEGAGIWEALPLTGFPDEQRWVDQIRERVGPKAHVLELLAGSARLGCALAAAGNHVTAVDREPAMIAQAHRRRAEHPDHLSGSLDLVCADATDLNLPARFDAVIIAETSSSLLTHAELTAMFRAAAAHLRPGGVLLLDYVSGDVPPTDLRGAVEPVPSLPGRGTLLASERPERSGGTGEAMTTAATWVWRRPDGTSCYTTDRHRRWTRRLLREALGDAGFDIADVTSPPDSVGDPRPVRLCAAHAHGAGRRQSVRERESETVETATDDRVEVPA